MPLHRTLHLLATIAGISLSLATAATANDGGIAYGGSPRLLNGHPTISMRSEVVRMTVGENNVTVDCRFVFANNGPACFVRMGFPDQGEGAEDPDEESGPDWRHKPPRSTFTTFQSYVDGKPVATRLIRANEPGQFWHEKRVSFPAHGRRVIRDLYTQRLGAQITRFNSVAHQASYILHTGASWHGPIGRSEIIVTFRRRRMLPPLSLIRVSGGSEARIWSRDWSSHPRNIYYRGPGRPTVSGRSLHVVRTDWVPAKGDDLWLVFDNTKI